MGAALNLRRLTAPRFNWVWLSVHVKGMLCANLAVCAFRHVCGVAAGTSVICLLHAAGFQGSQDHGALCHLH